MRDLARTDLPELRIVSERLRSLVARSSLGFALLAGIGAVLLFGDLMRAIASAVVDFAGVDLARLERAPRPYDFQEILGPAAGLVVARAAGGVPGAFAYLAYSGIVLALGWLGRILTCAEGSSRLALGLSSFCVFGPLDLLAGAAPLLIGLTVGVVAARAIGGAPRAGTNPLLEAAGAHVVPSVVFAFAARALASQAFGLSPQQVAFIVATTIISGGLSGIVAGLRSSTPVRTAFILTAVLVGTWLYPLGARQFRMAAGSDRPEVFLFALPLLDLVTIPPAAWSAGRWLRVR